MKWLRRSSKNWSHTAINRYAAAFGSSFHRSEGLFFCSDTAAFTMPTISFYLATTADPMNRGHARWNDPLPERRPRSSQQSPNKTEIVTYGDYFSVVTDFCALDGWISITKAASAKLGCRVTETDLSDVSIFLVKHGAFYHPARLRVSVADQTLSFVVNVAASADGRKTLSREVRALERLNAQRPFGWLPAVYGHVSDPVPMFLGEWFDGFHEFHLTRKADGDDLAVVVWDGADTRCLLTENQTADLYRNAAMILTACYDPITTCQVFPWHHAAGDFVVRIEGDKVAVRLITVRNFAPVVATASKIEDEKALLDNLIDFLIHLSMRMRLDRLDGVSEIVWVSDDGLEPMIDGFFQGLDLTGRMSGFPEDFPAIFGDYFNNQDAAMLTARARLIAETVFSRRSEEGRVIGLQLERHLDGICRILAQRK